MPAPPSLNLSTSEYPAILQGIDFVLILTFGDDEELAADDKFVHHFREDMGERSLGKTETCHIDMDERTVFVYIDGETTAQWFRGKKPEFDLAREFPIEALYQHTDVKGIDRPDSGIEVTYRFRVTSARA